MKYVKYHASEMMTWNQRMKLEPQVKGPSCEDVCSTTCGPREGSCVECTRDAMLPF